MSPVRIEIDGTETQGIETGRGDGPNGPFIQRKIFLRENPTGPVIKKMVVIDYGEGKGGDVSIYRQIIKERSFILYLGNVRKFNVITGRKTHRIKATGI